MEMSSAALEAAACAVGLRVVRPFGGVCLLARSTEGLGMVVGRDLRRAIVVVSGELAVGPLRFWTIDGVT